MNLHVQFSLFFLSVRGTKDTATTRCHEYASKVISVSPFFWKKIESSSFSCRRADDVLMVFFLISLLFEVTK